MWIVICALQICTSVGLYLQSVHIHIISTPSDPKLSSVASTIRADSHVRRVRVARGLEATVTTKKKLSDESSLQKAKRVKPMQTPPSTPEKMEMEEMEVERAEERAVLARAVAGGAPRYSCAA